MLLSSILVPYKKAQAGYCSKDSHMHLTIIKRKVSIKRQLLSAETTLSEYTHTSILYTQKLAHTSMLNIQNLICTQIKTGRKQRPETEEVSSTERKTWPVCSFGKITNVLSTFLKLQSFDLIHTHCMGFLLTTCLPHPHRGKTDTKNYHQHRTWRPKEKQINKQTKINKNKWVLVRRKSGKEQGKHIHRKKTGREYPKQTKQTNHTRSVVSTNVSSSGSNRY